MKKKPRGRPRKHPTDKDCRKVVELMSEGFSKVGIWTELNISRQLFYDWCERDADFYEAVKEGEALSEKWWRDLSREAALGKIDKFNATAWVFNMKNRFGWTDRQEVKSSVSLSYEDFLDSLDDDVQDGDDD